MPLINIFFWSMLILSGILGYQLLYAYAQAEHQAKRSAYRANVSSTHADRKSKASSPKAGHEPVLHGKSIAGKVLFIDIPTPISGERSEHYNLEFTIPRAAIPTEKQYSKIMAANTDCHHCA